MKGRQVDLIIPGASCLFWMGLTRENLSRGLYHTPEINYWAPIYCMSSMWHCLVPIGRSQNLSTSPPEEFASPPTTYLHLLVVHLCSVQLLFKRPPPSLTPNLVLIDLLQLPSNARPKSGMLQSAVWAASQMRLEGVGVGGWLERKR